MFSAKFIYDKRGYGDYVFLRNDDDFFHIPCRTGSIDKTGALINAMPAGVWIGHEPPVLTDEIAMNIPGLIGWKYRYWKDGQYTHYLSHPDGNKPGSEGCPVSQDLHNEYYAMFEYIHCIERQKELILEVGEV